MDSVHDYIDTFAYDVLKASSALACHKHKKQITKEDI